MNVVVHRAADIEKQQHFDLVVPLGHQLQIQKTGIVGGGADGAIHVQLFFGTFAGEFAQAPQRQLDIANTQLDIVVVVAEFAFVPNLHRAAMA